MPVKRIKPGESRANPIKMIKASLLRQNPYNPKHDFKKTESAALDSSLIKHGLLGSLIVFKYDWKEPGTFVVLEGNDRFKHYKTDEKIPCHVYDFINSDKELEELTLDFCAVGKKLNRTALYSLYSKRKNPGNVLKAVFEEVKMPDISQVNPGKLKAGFTQKTIVVTFESEESYLRFKQYNGSVTKVIREKSKLFKELEKRQGKINEYVEKYFFDIIFSK